MTSSRRWASAPTCTQAVGAGINRPAARRRRAAAGAAIAAMVASTLGVAAPAFAATPPVPPNDVTVFNSRDFVGLSYPTKAGQTATITVTRGGIVSGMASGVLDAAGGLEANHPGGVCWGTGVGAPKVTPNIKGGDEVTVTFSGGGSDSLTTLSPEVTSVTQTGPDIVVRGNLAAPGGPPANTAMMEQRIVAPDVRDTAVAKRDVRALPGLMVPDKVPDPKKGDVTAYTSGMTFTATEFIATYKFLDSVNPDGSVNSGSVNAAIAATGGARIMTWMDENPAGDRLGLTITEFGELGGPGMGGCPQGPENSPPNKPTVSAGRGGSNSLTANWTEAITFADGSPVTGYVVEAQAANDPTGNFIGQRVGKDVRSATILGLTNGTAYNVTVRAISAAGDSLPGAPSGPVTPNVAFATAPDAPTIVDATADNASATVRWTPPVNDGGATNTGFSVRVVDAAGVQVGDLRPAVAGATSLTVTGLANGTKYRFQVQAKNDKGVSPFSAASNTVTAASVPVAPVIGTVTPANRSALVRWTAPVNASTSAITGYSVRVLNATNQQVGALRTATAGATSLNVTGLTGGTLVRFQVQATNALGAGAFSAPSAVAIPKSTASMAGIRTAFSGAAGGAITARATWVKPMSNGGLIIRGYVVMAYGMSADGTIIRRIASKTQSQSTFALSMTLPKGNYRFAVRARNTLGLGANSRMSNLVTAR